MSLPVTPTGHPASEAQGGLAVEIRRLRALALGELQRMYVPSERSFVFRLRRTSSGTMAEGLSRRYTAISVIGLAAGQTEDVKRVLAGDLDSLRRGLLEAVGSLDNLGDVALTLWAGTRAKRRLRQRAVERLRELRPLEGARFTVELAWALAALCQDDSSSAGELRALLAARLLAAFDPSTGMFPHVIGGRAGLRTHVACFADLVYPVQALALYAGRTGDRSALAAAGRCAEQIRRTQGEAGQWWWHYDVRTGRVVEGYPVYSVHQHAMAPLALFALREAGGADHGGGVEQGIEWLLRSPELGGGSLLDTRAGLIWRKVARREPGKLARSLQALAARVHTGLRAPGLDQLLPPGRIDYECRPYEMGWLLYAHPEPRGGRV